MNNSTLYLEIFLLISIRYTILLTPRVAILVN